MKNELIEALKGYPQWVSWKMQDATKIPTDPHRGGYARR